MTIIEDTGQKAGQHDSVREYCEKNNIIFRRQKLNVGDYQSPPRAAVDTKKGLEEVYSNVVHDHGRFRDECIRAQEDGIKLYILIEEKSVRELHEVKNWQNPQQKRWERQKAYNQWLIDHGKEPNKQTKPPVSSERLMGMMEAMTLKYGVEWVFVHPDRVGEFVYRLLTLNE